MGGETHGGIWTVECAGPSEPSPPVAPNATFTLHLGERPAATAGQNLSAYRVKAPFILTRMRDWRGLGRKQMWLWSLRGRQWVIDQEFYLRQDESEMPAVETVLVRCDR